MSPIFAKDGRTTGTIFAILLCSKLPLTLTLRKFASSWLATALASRVLPVPGGPYSR